MQTTPLYLTLVLLFPLAAAATPAPAPGTLPTLTKTLPASGIDQIKLLLSTGKVRVLPSTDHTIRLRAKIHSGKTLHFIFDWRIGGPGKRPPRDLAIRTRRGGHTLVIGLNTRNQTMQLPAPNSSSAATPATSESGSTITIETNAISKTDINVTGWSAQWTLWLPPRMAFSLIGGVGEVQVQGLYGGLKVKLGVGRLKAELPRGPVTAELGTGQIRVRIAASDYGNIHLASGIGNVQLQVDGKRIRKGYKRNITAATQKLRGDAKTAYKLQAGIGNVILSLGSPLTKGIEP